MERNHCGPKGKREIGESKSDLIEKKKTPAFGYLRDWEKGVFL